MNVQSDIATRTGPATGIARQFAAFAHGLDGADIPATVRTRAHHTMLDAAGIAVASTRYPFAAPVLAGFQALGDEGRVPVFGMNARLTVRDAAAMNGYLAHGLDFDDTHITGVLHPTASLLPALFSAAHMTGASGRDLVTAYIVGVECGARLGTCTRGAFHQSGFHPTAVIGIFGCVLAVGRLMDLTEQQLVEAQGLALSMASGSLEFLEDGAWNKRLHPGWAASSAITACALAQNGFIGASKPYDGRFGLFNIMGGKFADWVDLSQVTDGLGEVWEVMNVGIKPFPTCHLTHAAIDSALALRTGLDLAEIASIEVRVPHEAFTVVCEPEANKKRPQSDYDAKFSVHYLVAAALMRGQLTLDELEPDVFRDADILALTDKVSFAAYEDSPFPEAYSGALTITMTDGSIRAHDERVNRGAADRPLSNAEIVAKYRGNARLWADAPRVAAMEAAMLSLDTAPAAVSALSIFSEA